MRNFFLESERIGFSTWNDSDLSLALELWRDPLVTRYLCANRVFTEKEVTMRLALERSNELSFGIQYWPIFLRKTEEFLGCCGLRPYDLKQDIYEMGFHLKSTCWGFGYGQEAARAVIEYAMQNLEAKNIFAGHHPENLASQKLLVRLGFHFVQNEFYPPTGLEHPSYLWL